MSLKVFTLNESEQWDGIVKSFKKYDVYYLSGYAKAFHSHGDGVPLLFYFDNGNTRAINVAMKRDIATDPKLAEHITPNTYFDLVTPYGYGGFLLEGDDYAELTKHYTLYNKEHNIVSEFVRFHPLLQNALFPTGIYDTHLAGDTVTIDLTDADSILNNLTSTRRNEIRTLLKNTDLTIHHGTSKPVLDSFITIYNSTMDESEATPYYYFNKPFYENLLADLKNQATIFYVTLGSEIISAAIMLFCNHNMHYHLSGTKRGFNHLSPAKLLLYEAARWGSANGYREFHLGGGRGAKRDSLYKFKKSFNKHGDRDFHTGKAIFDSEAYDKLVNIRIRDTAFDQEIPFFPHYRA